MTSLWEIYYSYYYIVLLWYEKENRKKKKRYHNTDPYRLVHTPYSVLNPPRSGLSYFPSGDSRLCHLTLYLFFSSLLFCWLFFTFPSSIPFESDHFLLRVSLRSPSIVVSSLPIISIPTHTRTREPTTTCTLFPLHYPFHLIFFSRFHITREISERCRGTGKPSPERTVDGEPVVLRPPVNAFWIPPGLAYVIGRPSLTSTHP